MIFHLAVLCNSLSYAGTYCSAEVTKDVSSTADATISSTGVVTRWTGNIATDVMAISDNCANAVDMLQWYSTWYTSYLKCTGSTCIDSCAFSASSVYQIADGTSWTSSSNCDVNQPIPLCRSVAYKKSESCPSYCSSWYCVNAAYNYAKGVAALELFEEVNVGAPALPFNPVIATQAVMMSYYGE